MKKLLLISSIVVLVVLSAFVVYIFTLNMDYKGSVSLCSEDGSDCAVYEGQIRYDSMDGIYFVKKVYTDLEVVDFAECIVRTSTIVQAECKDVNSKVWFVSVHELRK